MHDPNGFTALGVDAGPDTGGRPAVHDARDGARPSSGGSQASKDALTSKTEMSPDPGGAQTVLGTSPATVMLSPDRKPVARAGTGAAGQSADAAAAALYTLSYVGLYCSEESSWDQGSNSDEPYVSFNMYDDSNRSWARRTVVYSDVDRKETRGPNPNPMVLFGPAHLPTERTFVSRW